jgi:acyl-coenzyme A synthetase/AMP-(fatty) acid ligase
MKTLPRYAVPAEVDLVDAFPRTTSGKIDRRALQLHRLKQMDENGHVKVGAN